MKKIFLTAIIALILTAPVFVSAQGLKDAGKILDKAADTSKTGLSADLATTISTVIKAVLALVGTVFLVLTIYAGILWMTAQGNEEQVSKAVGIIKASVIGMVVIMSAYAITFFVTNKLGGVAGTGSTKGCCYKSDYSVCAKDILQSECDTQSSNNLWSAGACSSSCAP
jgi:hypothetical protein